MVAESDLDDLHNRDDRPDGLLCPSLSIGDVTIIGDEFSVDHRVQGRRRRPGRPDHRPHLAGGPMKTLASIKSKGG
jgi:hypothetical protein